MIKLSSIKKNPNNPRLIKDDKFQQLCDSINKFPKMFKLRPIIIDENNVVLGGNMRLQALKELKFKEIPDEWVKKADELTEEQKKEFIIKDNLGYGEWNWQILNDEWSIEELEEWGLSEDDFQSLDDDFLELPKPKKLLDRFIIPPFSVLDTKLGYWQQRKNWWLDKGIKSELGRKDGLTYGKTAQPPRYYEIKNELKAKGLPSDTDAVFKECERKGIKLLGNENGSTSIFDPVLCELAYQWFNLQKGSILDPFAGGSVRGIVASMLGFDYYGNDLSKEQIEANYDNAKEVLNNNIPNWTTGDSKDIDKIMEGKTFDFLFSCPPYADLEVYSDDPGDISNMEYSDFLNVYKEIIQKSCEMLKENRFAVFVVGDIRDKQGRYRNFVSHTIEAFIESGLSLYNEMILVNQLASLAIRVGNQFGKFRKIGKHHQNVLVFYKGDTTKIKEHFPELDFSYLEESTENIDL